MSTLFVKTFTKSLILLQFCRPYINSKLAITCTFYYQFIFCHMIYIVHTYDPHPKYVTKNLFCSKKPFWLITNLHHIPAYIVQSNDLFKHLNFLTLFMLNVYFTSIEVFKNFMVCVFVFLHDSYRFSIHFNLCNVNKLHITTCLRTLQFYAKICYTSNSFATARRPIGNCSNRSTDRRPKNRLINRVSLFLSLRSLRIS